MCESVDDRSADAESGKRARTGHESDFGDVAKSTVILLQLVANESKELFGESIVKNITIFVVV